MRITESFTGFSNQMIFLASGIVSAAKRKSNVIVVQGFLDNINTTNYSAIGQILNLEETNLFLKEKYNLILADRNNLVFELVCVLYGTPSAFFNVTKFIKAKCFHNNQLRIPKGLNFNRIRGDPCLGTAKNILVNYKVNGHFFSKNYGENPTEDILLNVNGPYIVPMEYPLDISVPEFDPILKNFVFSAQMVHNANIVMSKIDVSKKINVIHLRMEQDGIAHWSKQNHTSEESFKQSLKQIYINLIKEHISPEDETIVLTSSFSNEVIDFLNNNHYSYRFVDKFFQGREKNAIVDLLVSRMCNNVFIGNGGSTFSRYVEKVMTGDWSTMFYINLNNLKDEISVVKK